MELHEDNSEVQREIKKTVNFRQKNVERTTRAIDPDDLVSFTLYLILLFLFVHILCSLMCNGNASLKEEIKMQ